MVAWAGCEEAQFQGLGRMHGADGSVRRAGDFLAAAQAAGLLAQLDRWVMERALALLQQRRAESRPVRLFVSQTPRSLGQDGFAGWLQQTLERAGVDGPSLVIDIRQEDAVVHTVPVSYTHLDVYKRQR